MKREKGQRRGTYLQFMLASAEAAAAAAAAAAEAAAAAAEAAAAAVHSCRKVDPPTAVASHVDRLASPRLSAPPPLPSSGGGGGNARREPRGEWRRTCRMATNVGRGEQVWSECEKGEQRELMRVGRVLSGCFW